MVSIYNQITQVDIERARIELDRLLDLVEQGETVTIARSSKPVAELVRARSSRR
jgi:antitoxin (DNA-binding transcriptional repressor) of toxin-antitoxin stability system